MNGEKFRNTFISIKGILGLIEAKDVAIPEHMSVCLEEQSGA